MMARSSNLQTQARRAQIFTIDLILGLAIAAAAFIALALYLPSEHNPLGSDLARLDALWTEGIPPQWNASTVQVPGLLSGGRINATKLALFEAMNTTEQQQRLGLQSNIQIRFADEQGPRAECSSCGSIPATYKHSMTRTRYGVLNGTLVRMQVTLTR